MRNPARISIYAALVLGLLTIASARAADITHVDLKTATGKGVGNVLVFATNLRSGVRRGGTTSRAGRVSFRDLPAGPTQLRIVEPFNDAAGREGWRYVRVEPGSSAVVAVPYDQLRMLNDYDDYVAQDGILALRDGDEAGYGVALGELQRRVDGDTQALDTLNPMFDPLWNELAASLPPDVRNQLEADLLKVTPHQGPDVIDAARERAAAAGDGRTAEALARMAFLARTRQEHRRTRVDAMDALDSLRAARR